MARATRGGLDAAYGAETVAGVRTSINITQRPGRGRALDPLVREGRREVAALAPGIEVTATVPARLDGAAGARYDVRAPGATLRQVGVLRRGSYHVITLTAAPRAFAAAVRELDGLLRSWKWE